MISSYQRLLLVPATVLAIAIPAAAQTSDPGQVEKLLKTGDIVFIVDGLGSETHARIERVVDGAIEFRAITPGDVPNEYRVGSDVTTIRLEQISGLTRTDAFGSKPEPLYQRRDSFGSLNRRLKLGQVVRVTQRSGDETVGKVTEISPSGLVIATRIVNPRDGSGRPHYEWDGARTFTPAAVATIAPEAHIWDGAVKGAAIAIASMLILTHDCFGRYDCNGVGFFYALSLGIGAGVGLGIDAAIPARTIYRAPK